MKDFCALRKWLDDPKCDRVLRDMAGNAFSANVALSVLTAVLSVMQLRAECYL